MCICMYTHFICHEIIIILAVSPPFDVFVLLYIEVNGLLGRV